MVSVAMKCFFLNVYSVNVINKINKTVYKLL